MSEERSMILRMLKDEKISMEEAEALLDVLDEKGVTEEPGFSVTGTVPDEPGAGGRRREAPASRADSSEARGSRDSGSEQRADAEQGSQSDERDDDVHGFFDFRELRDGIRATVRSVRETVQGALQGVGDIHVDIQSELKRAFGRRSHERLASLSEDLSGAGTLVVENPWGDLRADRGESNAIAVDARITAYADTEERARAIAEAVGLHIERQDDRVRLVVKPDEAAGLTRTRIDLEIRLPRDLGLEAVNKSGDISVTGLSGAVDVRSASGNVEVSGLTAGAHAATASGSVTASDISGPLTVESVSGDLVVRRAHDGIRVSTTSGDIIAEDISGGASCRSVSGDLAVRDASGNLTGKTVSGDIALRPRATESRGYRVVLESRTGDVEWEGPIEATRRTEHRLEGTFGAGLDELRFDTLSGDIQVVLTADPKA